MIITKDPATGWLLLDKPSSLPSARATARIKRLLGARKAGHVGTLDPLASGLLPIALGAATKVVSYMQASDKRYLLTICWGRATDTDDRLGQEIAHSAARPNTAQIAAALGQFLGPQQQKPPRFSAIKDEGVAAYVRARRGQPLGVKHSALRPVTIFHLELLREIDADHAEFLCTCSKGTYMRSLARDLGSALGCYGHLSELRRCAVGDLDVKDAVTLCAVEKSAHNGDSLERFLYPLTLPLKGIPQFVLTPEQTAALAQGQAIARKATKTQEREAPLLCALADTTAFALLRNDGERLHPLRIFAPQAAIQQEKKQAPKDGAIPSRARRTDVY